LAASRFTALRRLYLSQVKGDVLHTTLCSPQLQQLETLTLGSIYVRRADGADNAGQAEARLDWSLCFANLRSLRTLSLNECGGANKLLTAIQTARPPSLRRIRFRHSKPTGAAVADPALLSALLAQLPGLAVELLKTVPELDPADPAWAALRAEWTELGRRHPGRAVVTEFNWQNGDERDPFDW